MKVWHGGQIFLELEKLDEDIDRTAFYEERAKEWILKSDFEKAKKKFFENLCEDIDGEPIAFDLDDCKKWFVECFGVEK